MKTPLISICIPAYNRPQELQRLLHSIDVQSNELEIIICEDKSSKRKAISKVVQNYTQRTTNVVRYSENQRNLGYDANLRTLLKHAKGQFIVFMGDDDAFVPGALGPYLQFLKDHRDLGFVFRAYEIFHSTNNIETFRHFGSKPKFFKPGEQTLLALYRKSIFISGFTIKREALADIDNTQFDGLLLLQLYLLIPVAMQNNCAYYPQPLVRQYTGGVPMFGTAKAEKKLYTPGTRTTESSVRFLSGLFTIAAWADVAYGLKFTEKFRQDLSKYSFPLLAIQRDKGLLPFIKYLWQLRSLHLSRTIYYHIYYLSLLLFGRDFCERVIRWLKNSLGRIPQL